MDIPKDHPIHGMKVHVVKCGTEVDSADGAVTVTDEMMAVNGGNLWMTQSVYDRISAGIRAQEGE